MVVPKAVPTNKRRNRRADRKNPRSQLCRGVGVRSTARFFVALLALLCPAAIRKCSEKPNSRRRSALDYPHAKKCVGTRFPVAVNPNSAGGFS